MEQATIIKRDGTKINLVSKDPFRAPTYFSQEYGLKSDDYIKISLKSADILDFGIGDKIVIGSDTYTIRTNNTREIVSDNSYTYELTFYGAMYDLMRQMYRNCDAQGKSDKSTFDLTYSLKDFAKVIIYNMERDYPGEWVLDENNVPDTAEKTITFDGQNCLQVLQTLCNSDNYDYDFLITQEDGVHTLHLGKFGSVITPPNNESYFEVGKGKGLYKLKEDKVDDKSIITRLWVEGGSTNIRSEYRDYAGRLQLPYPQRVNTRAHTLSDGTVIAAGSMYIGIANDTKRYFEDEDLKNKIGSIEDYIKTDDIFPCRTGKVTALGSDVYSFVDDTMNFDLNEKDSNGTKWLITDTTAKITFTSGYLAGQQFELKKSGGYVHATKTFSVIKYTDERGMSFPSETSESFQIRVGDTYKITDINLPTAYENDAEEDLFFYGYDKFLQAKQARVQYTATFTEDFFIHHLPTDSTADIFHVGDYLPIKDTRFGVEKNIRIVKVTRNLMKRYDYTITVSDTNSETVVSQIVSEVINHETIINRYGMKDPTKARRGWRTTEDLRNMVFDTDGYFDGTNIKPNSIDTNMLTVGSKSQQFVLVGITLQANVSGLPNRFDASAGILAHLTIDENSIKMWNLTASSVTLSESGGYYVYAKCSKSGNTGSYYITQEQLKFEPANDSDNYYFLIGIIGSLQTDDNFRDFSTTYGFTRINGRTITTGRIISSDGYCYLDLDSNLFQLADASTIDRATSGIGWSNGRAIIKGVLVQNQGGSTAELGLYRGVYDDETVYYKGDEVSYDDGSQLCTYRYINSTESKGNIPTNSIYWNAVAKGLQGDKGINGIDGIADVNSEFYEYRYAKNGSTVTPPDLNTSESEPAGWSKNMPTIGALEYLWCTIAKKSSLVDNTMVHLPINASDTTSIADTSGKGRNATLSNGATIVSDSRGYVLNLNGTGESQIPIDLPWGKSFTICFWVKTDMSLSWMLNCYLGREYIEQSISMTANQWAHLTFRFNEKTITVFKDGTQIYIGSTKEVHAGFSLYDDNMFGTNSEFDDIRVFDSALSISDINKVIAGTADNLIVNWSTPIRTNGADGSKGDKGDKGESPVLVYRGIYDAGKTYYGNNTRLEAVKYNGIYYITRIDAGSFSGTLPTSSSKWNTFGAELETIATNLLLAEGANIGDWFMSGGKIVSTLSDGNKITLDASSGEIILISATSGGDYSLYSGWGSIIRLDVNNGVISVDAKTPPSYTTGSAYMSPTGIFANCAGTNAMPASSGYTHQGAIVGLGFANVNKNEWQMNGDDTIVSGIYGRSNNVGTAPHYGGFFYGLKTCGFIKSTKYITDNSPYNDRALGSYDTTVVGLCNYGVTQSVYLPNDGYEGREIEILQMGQGTIRIYVLSGQHIYDDDSENSYYDIPCGCTGVFKFAKYTINSVTKEIWIARMYKFL